MLYQWLQNITFAWPEALSLLLILPLLIFWYSGNEHKRQASMLVTTTHFIADVRNAKTWLKHAPFVLRCIALVFLIVALARPQDMFAAATQQHLSKYFKRQSCAGLAAMAVAHDIPLHALAG